MNLFGALVSVGGRLGVVKIVSTTAPAKPGKIPTRKITLKDLATEVRAEEVRTLAELPAELSVDFAKVFEAAGIVPAQHGWTVDRLRQVLDTEQYRSMDRSMAQKAILGLLAADSAHVHEVVQDAVARDKALDAFEGFAAQKMKDRTTVRQRQVADIETQIQALQEQVARLAEEAKADQAQWKQWHDKKIQCEKDMARAIGILVEDAVISVDHDHE